MSYDDRDDDLEEDDDDLDIRLPGVTVPTYLTQAILVTLFCCLPFGIVAISNASKVSTHLDRGEYEQAVQASQEAKKWCMIGVIVGIPVYLFLFCVRAGGLRA
jgi:hypothetical protein